jgi:hypothetical protein
MIIAVQLQSDLWHDTEVDPVGGVLNGELRRVRDGVERLNRRPIVSSGVRVAMAIDHQKRELGYVDQRRLASGRM